MNREIFCRSLWVPASHIIIALNLAGFKPGTFLKTATYNDTPIGTNVGFAIAFSELVFLRYSHELQTDPKR